MNRLTTARRRCTRWSEASEPSCTGCRLKTSFPLDSVTNASFLSSLSCVLPFPLDFSVRAPSFEPRSDPEPRRASPPPPEYLAETREPPSSKSIVSSSTRKRLVSRWRTRTNEVAVTPAASSSADIESSLKMLLGSWRDAVVLSVSLPAASVCTQRYRPQTE